MKRIGQQSRLQYPLWKYFVGPDRKSNICNPPPEILQVENSSKYAYTGGKYYGRRKKSMVEGSRYLSDLSA